MIEWAATVVALLLNTGFPPGRMLFCLDVCVGVCGLLSMFVLVLRDLLAFISPAPSLSTTIIGSSLSLL